MAQPAKPNVVYHADWGSKEEKRWCVRAALGAAGRYTAFAPEQVGNLGSLIGQLRTEAGETGCAFAGFDFPIGVPAYYAKRAGISSFRDVLPKLGRGEWKDFYSVCDEPGQISVPRPFYPNGRYKGRRKQELFLGHGVSSVEPLLRRCERGGNGQRQACCLFWTLGGNQVEKPQSRVGLMCSLLPCRTSRCGRLTAPCSRCLCREASLLPRRGQPSVTAGSPRSGSAASATGATGESSAHRSFAGLMLRASLLRMTSRRKFGADSRKGMTPLMRSSASSECSRCA